MGLSPENSLRLRLRVFIDCRCFLTMDINDPMVVTDGVPMVHGLHEKHRFSVEHLDCFIASVVV